MLSIFICGFSHVRLSLKYQILNLDTNHISSVWMPHVILVTILINVHVGDFFSLQKVQLNQAGLSPSLVWARGLSCSYFVFYRILHVTPVPSPEETRGKWKRRAKGSECHFNIGSNIYQVSTPCLTLSCVWTCIVSLNIHLTTSLILLWPRKLNLRKVE
jgi:hypothetical protein